MGNRGRLIQTIVVPLCLLIGGCESGEEVGRTRENTETPQQNFARPPRVSPPDLKPNLNARHINDCLYPQRIDPDSIAGVYYGPTDLIEDQVETSRSLELDLTSEIQMLEREEFAQAVEEIAAKPPRPAQKATTRSLAWALGLTPIGLNVNEFLKGEGTGLLAGFYDPDTGRIVVEKKGELNVEYVVLAHELAHAAADQAFGIPKTKPGNIVDDGNLAVDSLIEGDATLVQLRTLSRLTRQKAVRKAIKETLKKEDEFKEDRSAGVPYLLMDNVLFPYQWGLAFACSVFKEKGWKGINQMYARPPTTTAQIMFPERYLHREQARTPSPLSKPPRGWNLRSNGEFGAAHLKGLFEAPGDLEGRALKGAVARTAAWAGGHFEAWTKKTNESRYVVGLSLVEHPDHRGLLCSSMNAWYRSAFGAAEPKLVADRTMEYDDAKQDAVISCAGRNVLVGIGPNAQLARSLLASD